MSDNLQPENELSAEETPFEQDAPLDKELRVEDEPSAVNTKGRKTMIALIIVLIIILLLACGFLAKMFLKSGAGTNDTGGLTWVRSVYGFGKTQDELISPASVAVNADGTGFWVADQDKFRLVQFDWNGKLKSVFLKDKDNNVFDFPSDIAVARDGWIYVAQSSYGTVKVYSPDHKLQQTLQVPQPMSVTVNDDMAVVGSTSGFVAFKRDGTLIGWVGERGKGENQFDTINGVVLDKDSNLYVVDTFNNRLSKYNADGDRLWIVGLGRPGNAGANVRDEDLGALKKKYPAMLQMPMGATIDNSGRIVIIDTLDFSVSAFSPKNGKFLGKWGTFGTKDGQLAYSSDIDYDKGRDWFVVTDTGNQRAEIFRVPGSGGDALSGLRRGLSGPLGACLIPLLLIILFTILSVIWKRLKKKREQALIDRAKNNALEEGGETSGLLSDEDAPSERDE